MLVHSVLANDHISSLQSGYFLSVTKVCVRIWGFHCTSTYTYSKHYNSSTVYGLNIGDDDQKGVLKLLFLLLCVQPRKGGGDLSYLFSAYNVSVR